MIALVVDSDSRALDEMTSLLGEMPELTKVAPFSHSTDALQWAEVNAFDLALISVRADSADMLMLARQLRRLKPACGLVFCAASGQYAVDAFDLHANGYLLRPIRQERLHEEIAYLYNKEEKKKEKAEEREPDKLLTIRCCGGFEAFDRSGTPISFRRSRSRELLALLVDRRGMSITSKEICAIFWEDDGERDQKNMAHLWQLFSELNRALRQVGAEGVVKRSGVGHYVDMARLDCPDLERGQKNRSESAYLKDYSWADIAEN